MSHNIALGLRLILEAAEQVKGYTRPGRGIARARQVEAFQGASAWIRSLPKSADAVDLPNLCAVAPEPATIGDMPTRKPDPIRAVSSHLGFRLTRPGARYAVRPEGDARPGAWLPEGEALPLGWTDVYPENEARALLPFLRATSHGRRAAEPTTPDGKLIARACKRFGLTAAALGEKIGAAEAVLSRARNGELPAKHRDAIRALLAPKKRKQKATT